MEYFDLYDENRNKLNKIHQRGTPLAKGVYRLVVHICIFNSKGEMIIQKRNADKPAFPNYWDISVGGSVQCGETSYEGAKRESAEELGFNLNLNDTRPHFTINFDDGFDDFYIVTNVDKSIEDFIIQKEELSEIKWATKDEIKDLIAKNQFVPYNCIETIFAMKNNRCSFLLER